MEQEHDNPLARFDKKPINGLSAAGIQRLAIIVLLLVIIVTGGNMYIASENRAAIATGDTYRCWDQDCHTEVSKVVLRRAQRGY